MLENRFDKEIINTNNFSEASYFDEMENRHWKYWLFLKEKLLFFASYNCQKDDIGKEDKVVSEIVYSAL